MAISIGKIEGLHTLVVGLTGIVLVSVLALDFLQLEKEQQDVGRNNLTLRDLDRLQDGISQWLLLGDLIYASGETYLVQGALSQGRLTRDIGANIAASTVGQDSIRELAQLDEIYNRGQTRLQQAAEISFDVETERTSLLLTQWDTDAAKAIELMALLRANVDQLATDRSMDVSDHRSQLVVKSLMTALFYLLLVLVMWMWVRWSVVKPIVTLTDATDDALKNNKSLNLEEQGPDEIKLLTRSVKAFIGQLEQREESLVQEVETRRQAELAAAAAQKIAEDLSMAKVSFLANMSHEIRTPMNGVLGMITLLEETELSKEQQDYLRTASISGQSLMTILNDILDVAKVDMGRMEIEVIEFDLHRLVEDVVQLMSRANAAQELEMGVLIDAQVPQSVRGDPTRIRQILSNMINNSLKFTNAGEVLLRVSYPKKNMLHLEVSDTGIGIDSEAQTRIFDSFAQADESTTRKFGGTGLGLALCKQLTTLMGGEIGVKSNPGEGSKFWFTVNISQSDNSLRGFSPSRKTRSPKILVLSQNHTTNKILNHYLTQWKLTYEVVPNISNVKQACNSKNPIEFVVIDAACPYTAVRAMKEITKLAPAKHAHCIAICQKYQSDTRAILETGGFHSFLNKPLSPSKLHDSLLSGEKPITPKATRVSDTADSTNHSSKHRILLVEDNPVNQKVAQGMLKILGCDVETAVNGREAVDALEDKSFDLVFMDCQMPVMDGLQATRLIREKESQSGSNSLPIVAMTAHALQEHRDASMLAGMNDHITKPFSKNELQRLLNTWCP